MTRDTAAKPKDSAATAAKACVFCLPFCGLGESESLAVRLKTCGIQLLEQATAPQPELSGSLNRS